MILLRAALQLAGALVAASVGLAAATALLVGFALVWLALGLLVAAGILVLLPAVSAAVGLRRGLRGYRRLRRQLLLRL